MIPKPTRPSMYSYDNPYDYYEAMARYALDLDAYDGQEYDDDDLFIDDDCESTTDTRSEAVKCFYAK